MKKVLLLGILMSIALLILGADICIIILGATNHTYNDGIDNGYWQGYEQGYEQATADFEQYYSVAKSWDVIDDPNLANLTRQLQETMSQISKLDPGATYKLTRTEYEEKVDTLYYSGTIRPEK